MVDNSELLKELEEYAKDNFPGLYEELQNATEENLEEVVDLLSYIY